MNIPKPEQILSLLPVAVAYHRAIRNEVGHLVDLEILDTNEAWCEATHLHHDVILHKGLLEVVPALKHSTFNWLTVAEHVLAKTKKETIEQYSEVLRRWFQVIFNPLDHEQLLVIMTDITREMRELNEKSEGLRSLHDFVFEISEQGVVQHIYALDDKNLIRPRSELIGKSIDESFPYASAIPLRQAMLQAKEQRQRIKYRNASVKPHTNIWYDIEVQYVRINQVVKYFVSVTDVTEDKLKDDAILASESKFRTYTMNAPLGVAVINENGLIREVNPQLSVISGYDNSLLIQHSIYHLFPEHDEIKLRHLMETLEVDHPLYEELDAIHADGTSYFVSLSIVRISTDTILIYCQDITKQRDYMQKVEYLSFHDELTGLYNRRYMDDSILRLDTPRNWPLTMVSVDINGLKRINDCCGHVSGDEYIRIIADCIKESCRADDVIARMGGDEFEIILPHTSAEQAESVRLRIIQHCANRTVVNQPVSIAIGYATKTSADELVTTIRKLADQRMYLSKEHRYTKND